MNQELLIEIGCEEIPAGWLPSLTSQFASHLESRLQEQRLEPSSLVETFSTPRRLTAHIESLPDRQSDLEKTVIGPPIQAAFDSNGKATKAAVGFAKKYAVSLDDLQRKKTSKGIYLVHEHHEPGKRTIDVLANVVSLTLRDFSFPKQMRWDAYLDDGKGEFVFARPIRWMILLYGGRVVPFTIHRNDLAKGENIKEVHSGSKTYGHRFLTAKGRAGRSIKIDKFKEYKAKLAENFVILDRVDRERLIRTDLETQAKNLGGHVSDRVSTQSNLLEEVPDLVEFPGVVSGHFPVTFLELPEEVLTTTMIHHQHYFPVVSNDGNLKPSFLAVTNTKPEDPDLISKNAERVLIARLRDAQFFWDEDKKVSLENRLDRLDTILFHKKLGSYKKKTERVAHLARWITETWGCSNQAAFAEQAGRLCKADLATEMVRELTELQGKMGGIYAREEGLPEQVWKAIYYHYLPVGVEAEAPPSKTDLGPAAIPWAAVALADKLDSVVGMFLAGERPTGSRDPFGLRRQAQGIVKILSDTPELTGVIARQEIGELLHRAAEPFDSKDESVSLVADFVADRFSYLLEQRGCDVRNIRAVLSGSAEKICPLDARQKLEVLPEFTGSTDFTKLAIAFKRIKNIAKELKPDHFLEEERLYPDLAKELKDSADLALLEELNRRGPLLEEGLNSGNDYRKTFSEAAAFGPAVDLFFKEVFVMTDDERLRIARLRLVTRLQNLILRLADISEIVPG